MAVVRRAGREVELRDESLATVHDIRHVGDGVATVMAVLASPDAPVGGPR